MDSRQQSSPSTAAARVAREHPGILLGLVPFVIVGVRILWQARGDSAVLAALVASVQFNQVLLSTFTTLMPVLVQGVTLYFVAGRIRLLWHDQVATAQFQTLFWFFFVANLLVCLVQPWRLALLGLVLAGVLLAAETLHWAHRGYRRRRDQPKRDPEDVSWGDISPRAAFVYLPLMILVLVIAQPSWQPTEDLTVGRQAPRTASILSETPTTLKVVWANGSVGYVGLDELTARVPCRRSSAPALTRIPILSDIHDRVPPPRCTQVD